MPIIHDCVQGSTEWLALRAGLPTASSFDRIITPKTGKPSSQAETYMHSLIAEKLMRRPILEYVSHWMDRGTQLEASAVAFYEFQRDVQTEKIGFITNDAGTVGASPDRLVAEDGLLEIKIPKESTQIGYLLKDAVDADYFPQLQGQLWISGRSYVDILSFHPELPPALIRVERDDAFIRMLAAAVTTFSEVLEAKYQLLLDRGLGRTQKDYAAPPSITELLKQSLIELNKA